MSKSVGKKISEPPSRLTENVQTALKDIAASVQALQVDLASVKLVKATNVEIGKDDKTKVIVVYVHINSLKTIQKIGKKLINELEKKLKSSVFITCKRNIQSRWIKVHKSQKRPRNRTLTAVHDALLEELCMPCNILGRRIRVRVDGTMIHKVILDKSDEVVLQQKVQVISQLYKKLTSKTIEIEFAEEPVYYHIAGK